MTDQLPNQPEVPLSQARRVDHACDRFEAQWQAGTRPQIEAALSDVPPHEQGGLLRELILLDVFYRQGRGETATADDYLPHFPRLDADWLVGVLNSPAQSGLEERIGRPTGPHPSVTQAAARKLHAPSSDGESIRLETVRYFGDYELLAEVARGGMGVVYKARQVSLNRIVAVKMILAGQVASAAEVERFQNEAEAAAQLDHPHIVPIYEVGVHGGQHYFSMGYVDGRGLDALMTENLPEPREAARMMAVVAEVVQYAHDKGVIHRDLKPSNILLDRDGKPRITDFGLAKRVEDPSGLTVTGQILGTPSFMPPEQAAGKLDAIGPHSDVYALGAVLYALLTGRPPFKAASSLQTLKQVLERDPAAPREVNPSVPRDLETIALKCLEKSIPRRYPTARAVADELRRFLDGRPIAARPVSRLERGWRWCWRNPVIAGLSAAVMLTLLVSTSVSTYFARRETQRAITEAKAKADFRDQLGETRKAESKAVQAHRDGRRKLAQSYLSEARVFRLSNRAGQRFGALRAIQKSLDVWKSLGEPPPRRELADEAAAALCLPDWEVDYEWDGFPPETQALALSPTFDRYARADAQGILSVRSLPDDREIVCWKSLGRHGDYGGLQFSDDGRFVMENIDGPRRSRVTRVDTGGARVLFEGDAGWPLVSPDGSTLSLLFEGRIELRSTATGEALKTLSVPLRLRSFYAWHPFRQELICSDGASWRVIDLESGNAGPEHRLQGALAAWPAMHPNGRWLMWTTNADHRGQLCDVESGNAIAPPFVEHQSEGVVPFLSRFGDAAFSNDWHGILRMWEPRTGRPLLNRPSTSNMNWLVVSHDNKRLGLEVAGRRLRTLRFEPGREYGRLNLGSATARVLRAHSSCAVADGASLIAVQTEPGCVLVDARTGVAIRDLVAVRDTDALLGFLDDGSLMVLDQHNLTRIPLRPDTDKDQFALGSSQKLSSGGAVFRSAVNRDANVLCVASPCGVWVYCLATPPAVKEPRAACLVHTILAPPMVPILAMDVRSLSVSPDGRFVALGLHTPRLDLPDRCALVYDLETSRWLNELPTRGLAQVRFSPRGKFLAVHSGETLECRIFDTASWKRVTTINSKSLGIFSPDETLFAIACGAGDVSLRKDSELREFARLSGPDVDTFHPLFFADDNSRLYACHSATRQIHFWNLALIRKSLAELDLAGDWPEISLASSPDVVPAPLSVTSEISPETSPKTHGPTCELVHE
jgi:serine/threonine protein kinase/WD40 repeat protein